MTLQYPVDHWNSIHFFVQPIFLYCVYFSLQSFCLSAFKIFSFVVSKLRLRYHKSLNFRFFSFALLIWFLVSLLFFIYLFTEIPQLFTHLFVFVFRFLATFVVVAWNHCLRILTCLSSLDLFLQPSPPPILVIFFWFFTCLLIFKFSW